LLKIFSGGEDDLLGSTESLFEAWRIVRGREAGVNGSQCEFYAQRWKILFANEEQAKKKKKR
jgi:hypothetical protein